MLAVDGELVEMLITPSHRNLQNRVQICDGAVPTHHKASPDHRTDAGERNVELIGRRSTRFKHASMLLHQFPIDPQLFSTLLMEKKKLISKALFLNSRVLECLMNLRAPSVYRWHSLTLMRMILLIPFTGLRSPMLGFRSVSIHNMYNDRDNSLRNLGLKCNDL